MAQQQAVTVEQLESHLWESANILRGPVDAADFKILAGYNPPAWVLESAATWALVSAATWLVLRAAISAVLRARRSAVVIATS